MSDRTSITRDEIRWNAVVNRHGTAQLAFYYAVKTTGVYCRPGCSSRLPKRKNVEFFETNQAAEGAGYRPCKRCKPDAPVPREWLAAIIARACRRLEESEDTPTLSHLAAEAGLSPWHFHRLFKKALGVTPKQYAVTHRMLRFRHSLKGKSSVTDAIYDAGFGSSSRAYENVHSLGMTPSTYKRGAVGLVIHYAAAPCFLGWVVVAATEKGICAVGFADDPETGRVQLQGDFPKARIVEADPSFSAFVQDVIAFLEAPDKGFDFPLDIQGTAFQQRVWSALREIPPGVTVSYAQIARRIGSPKAAHATGQACASNKLAGVIPCHRVLTADGELGGYRWGTERKSALLQREGMQFARLKEQKERHR